MGIQSSINQGLGTVAMGMGLWAHSPGGKKYLETKQLERDIKKAYKEWEETPGGAPGSVGEEAENVLYDRMRNLETRYAEVSPNAPSLSGGGETALERSISIKGERTEEAEAEKKAKEEAEQADIKNIRTQEFMNRVLSGTPSEYILQQQKGGTK
jgi:hypothetical protein